MDQLAKILVDGTTQFFGGQDSSRSAYQIDKDQYVRGINVALTSVGDNLTQRPAWICERVIFNSAVEQRILEDFHIQGGNWFFDGYQQTLIVSSKGYICRFTPFEGAAWYMQVLNLDDQNNPILTKCWTERLPGNLLLLCDGQSLPFVIGNGVFRRTDPSKDEIGVCRMMTYVQNRLFYVGEFGKDIFAGDFASPLTVKEAIATRIFGWHSPNDEDITAIGAQRFANIDENGGELLFSTTRNVYAVDVRGDRQDWGESLGSRQGFTRLVIPNFGATSQYGFVNFNANVYFRTINKGIFGYRQTLSQFNNDDDTVTGSVEVNNWLDNDASFMLDQCYMVNYKGRLLTTTQSLVKDGYVYWGGIVSMNPSPLYSTRQKLPRRYEGMWTGVQPWCLIRQADIVERLFVISHDKDGKNRLYSLDENSRFDLDADGKQRRIQSSIETRAYPFDSVETWKRMKNRYYTLEKVLTDLDVKIYSRASQKGEWTLFDEKTHLLPKCVRPKCLPFHPLTPEGRLNVFLADEKECDCRMPFEQKGNVFNSRMFRLELEGAYELSSFVCFASPEPLATILTNEEDRHIQDLVCLPGDLSYKVTDKQASSVSTQPVKDNARTTTNAASTCGCTAQ